MRENGFPAACRIPGIEALFGMRGFRRHLRESPQHRARVYRPRQAGPIRGMVLAHPHNPMKRIAVFISVLALPACGVITNPTGPTDPGTPGTSVVYSAIG